MTQLEARQLRDYYRTPSGSVVRRLLSDRVRARWQNVSGLTILGAGFATPYLGSFRAEAARLGCLMPARQGALVWPQGERCHSVLVEEHFWPISDNSVDRLLAVHCLEVAERAQSVLREIWRVLAPDGRLILIVPNRRGLWSRIDKTPFGQGQPYSRSQLEQQLTDALFTPVDWGSALFYPPLDRKLVLRAAPAIERSLAKVSPAVGGVLLVEARKELMAPVGGSLAANEVRVLRPAEASNGAR